MSKRVHAALIAALAMVGFSSCASVSREHSTSFHLSGPDRVQIGDTRMLVRFSTSEDSGTRDVYVLPLMVFEDFHHDGTDGYIYLNFLDETQQAEEVIVHSASMQFRGKNYPLEFSKDGKTRGARFEFNEWAAGKRRYLYLRAHSDSDLPGERREGEVLTTTLDIEIRSGERSPVCRRSTFRFVWGSRTDTSTSLVLPSA